MGKFAGFLKRAKNFALNVINKIAKGVKIAKNFTRKNLIKPGVDTMTNIFPIVKPITDGLFTLDDQLMKGIDWVIDKTENGAEGSSNLLNDSTETSREGPKTMIKEMLRNKSASSTSNASNNSYVGMTSDTINRPEKVVTFKGNSKPSYQSLF